MHSQRQSTEEGGGKRGREEGEKENKINVNCSVASCQLADLINAVQSPRAKYNFNAVCGCC